MNMNIKSAVMLFFPACACLCLRVSAATDLAATVKRFEALGLPNVANAEYVDIEHIHSELISIKSILQWFNDETSGNAWLLKETLDATGQRVGRFVINGGEIVDLRFVGNSEDLHHEKTESSFPAARWRKARLARDINATRRFLSDSASEMERSICAGRVFLFALQLFQRGDTKTATELMGKLCGTKKKRAETEKDALNSLADGQYATLLWDFTKDYDWSRYREGLGTLLARYPSGWTASAQIRALHTSAEQRVSEGVPPVIAPELSEADRRLAAELCTLRTRFKSHWLSNERDILWMIPAAWPTNAQAFGAADLAVRARGIEAIPLLLALTNDTALTGHVSADPHGKGRFASLGTSGTVPAPMTRGNLAIKILGDMLPNYLVGDSWDRNQTKTIRAAQDTYAAHQHATTEALAIIYLSTQWGMYMNSAAQTFLLNTARQKPVPEYAAYLARDTDLFSEYDTATYTSLAEALVAYAAVRGKDAQPWIDTFCTRLEQMSREYRKSDKVTYGDDNANAEHVRTTKAHLLQTAQTLRALRLDATDDELQSESGTQEEPDYRQIMLAARRGENPHEETDTLLPPVPLPPLSADERADCLRRLKAAPSRGQVATVLSNLNEREKAALPELLQTDAGLNATLADYAGTVTKISVQEDAALAERLRAWEGKRITVELVDAVKAYCETQTKAGRAVLGVLEREADLGGWTVTVRPQSETEKPDRIDGYCGLACKSGLFEDAAWRTNAAKPESHWGAMLTADTEQMQAFLLAVEQVCAGTHRVWSAGLIAFATEGDRK